jgi:tetratricopeptide (TPR) repeat protein
MLAQEGASPALRARLTLGKGRASYRAEQWQEARTALEEAARLAEQVGDDAYETYIISLVMLEMVLGELRCVDEAERVSERAIALTRERGDQLHFIAALTNRRLVQIARRNVVGVMEDLRSLMRLGRELGMILLEYVAEANLSELLYLLDELSAAEQHARRAIAIEERHPEVAGRGLIGVLRLARIEAYRGHTAETRALLHRLESARAAAAVNQSTGGTLTAADEVLITMLDLSTRDASTAEWEALLRRSEKESVEQDSIEVAELYGIWALRKGRAEEARRAFEEAARRAKRIPNIMEARIQKGLAATGGPLT